MSTKRVIGRLFLRCIGWETRGSAPEFACVGVGGPHTSGWDALIGVAVFWALGIRARWVGKHSLFRPPVGALLRALGGIPVDRSEAHGVVARLARALREDPPFLLLVAPEGSRHRSEYWRSGFYQIARAADVPLVLLGLDWRRRVGIIGPRLDPTGDREADMLSVRAFFSEITPRYPDRMGPIRLRPSKPSDPSDPSDP